jgi:hypothetical protein
MLEENSVYICFVSFPLSLNSVQKTRTKTLQVQVDEITPGKLEILKPLQNKFERKVQYFVFRTKFVVRKVFCQIQV